MNILPKNKKNVKLPQPQQLPILFSSFVTGYKYFFITDAKSLGYYNIDFPGVEDFKRLQYNYKDRFLKYIIIDCDNDDYKNILKSQKFPQPNIIISNKNKSGAHLFFVLDRPILKSKSFDYFKNRFRAVFKKLTVAYNGDPLNVGYIGKNFLNQKDFNHLVLSNDFITLEELEEQTEDIDTPKTKKELVELLRADKKINKSECVTKKARIKKFPELSEGRNCEIFDTVRVYAYGLNKDDNLYTLIYQKASVLNASFKNPLPKNEIEDTVKSIFKYVSTNKRTSSNYKKRIKKMLIQENTPTKEKQKLGAEYSANIKKAKTRLKIELAIIEMRSKGEKINIANLARMTSLHRTTISQNKDLFTS